MSGYTELCNMHDYLEASTVSRYTRVMAVPNLPKPFDYLDHREFLRDWFQAKCAQNSRYSHRMFAQRAGVKSPSLLHLVIKGERNLTHRTLPGFCKALGLDGDAKRFFSLLVKLDRSRTPRERNEIYQSLAAERRFRDAFELEHAGFDYISKWHVPAIRELAGIDGFRMDPEWVAKQLRPTITVAQARDALELLVRLGLIVPDTQGGATQRDVAVVTPHQVRSLAAYNYHANMIRLAGESLERFGSAERHVGAITLRVSEQTLAHLRNEVIRFHERMLALCDEDTDGDRVVQLNTQIFPLSKGAK